MIRKLGEGLGFLLFLAGVIALLGVVCINSGGFPLGEQTEHYEWISKVAIYCDLALCAAFVLCIARVRVFFRWDDLWVLVMMIGLLVRYDIKLGLSPERFYFLIQCGVLWFIFRIGMATYPLLSRLLPWIIVFFGVFEAVIGFLQLYGVEMSNHSLYLLTGDFFNPGPYSGYLAVTFAVGVGLYGTVTNRWMRYGLCVLLGIIVCLLPAGMSRAAWLAAGAGCVVVWLMRPKIREKIKVRWRKHPWLRRVAPAGITIILIASMIGLFLLKQDSAGGRLFIWKITARTVAERPFTGHGLGGFPSAYGQAQEDYFSGGGGSEWEERVAGSPEYAFNEYLQLASEGGVFLLAAALAFAGFSLYRGIRGGHTAAVAGVVAFGVFAFFSYPLQLPPMMLLLMLLLAVCQAPQEEELRRDIPISVHRLLAGIGLLGYLLFLLFTFYLREDYVQACRKWQTARVFYTTQAYELAMKEYAPLYRFLKDRPDYLFESAMCARQTEAYEHSNSLLARASLVSSDPMIQNIQGRNYEDMARRDSSFLTDNFRQSELYLWKSVYRLPGRLYPYYLLAKLYENPRYYHPELARQMARIVLTKKEKIPSPAIRQMRDEMMKLADMPPPSEAESLDYVMV